MYMTVRWHLNAYGYPVHGPILGTQLARLCSLRGSERSLISMSRLDVHCHGEGTNLGNDHQNQNEITIKNSNLFFLQNFNTDAKISFQKHFTISVILSNFYSFI